MDEITVTFQIDKELQHKFKTYCASKQVSMRDALTIAIQLILKEDRKK